MKELEQMSPAELDELIRSAEKAKADAEKRRKAEAKEKVQKILDEYGYRIGDLYPRAAGKSAPAGGTSDARYANPDDPSETWGGLGRYPKWLAERVPGIGEMSPAEKRAALERFRVE
ncbi:H-NS family nucleoid-associated regulatory protein [Rhodovulum euryhalinum]|uniref:DNA-binding protein H-NS n=1 Tax=Rhodovulum euryhalinum TaxID=35805 RepID=A0A4V2SA44_9RHOB|nr:H-NS histone family protein [Rhodovulum euryhalinum]TCO70250.1 DNA-binding protein H-NS [Rhodovulum euryhalinum]